MHWAATLAIIIILADSALSGLSQSMAELIAFRAIQGLGAGGLMVGAMATLGDIVGRASAANEAASQQPELVP
jgi:MFS family permease